MGIGMVILSVALQTLQSIRQNKRKNYYRPKAACHHDKPPLGIFPLPLLDNPVANRSLIAVIVDTNLKESLAIG